MSHQHSYPGGGDCVEIGPTVCVRPTVHGGDPDVTNVADGSMAGGPVEHVAGFIFEHDQAGRITRHASAVSVICADHPQAKGWAMTGSLEARDLTLTPSILCRADGFHGFITNGAWVPA